MPTKWDVYIGEEDLLKHIYPLSVVKHFSMAVRHTDNMSIVFAMKCIPLLNTTTNHYSTASYSLDLILKYFNYSSALPGLAFLCFQWSCLFFFFFSLDCPCLFSVLNGPWLHPSFLSFLLPGVGQMCLSPVSSLGHRNLALSPLKL